MPDELSPVGIDDSLPTMKTTRSLESVAALELPYARTTSWRRCAKRSWRRHPLIRVANWRMPLRTWHRSGFGTAPQSHPVDADEAWPHACCAFSGCLWTARKGTEEDLLRRLQEQHGSDLEPLAALLGNGHRGKCAFLTDFNAALSIKCRSGAPLAGSSVDRIVLEKFAEATAEDRVESLICFLCACTYTRIAETKIGATSSGTVP